MKDVEVQQILDLIDFGFNRENSSLLLCNCQVDI
jgi:hypothetical protein